jgi:putative hydrolase of the HAD superfamily
LRIAAAGEDKCRTTRFAELGQSVSGRDENKVRDNIKAVGFDLFNTLITVDPVAVDQARGRLVRSLRESDLEVDEKAFIQTHREAALRFMIRARANGRETHNRFWISAALDAQGHRVPPDDPRIAGAVDAYFSAYIEYSRVIPGTRQMLGILRERYRLGLLSNFTHAPAAWEVVNRLSLSQFFEAVIISGEVGYRKPHILVFQELTNRLGVKGDQIVFIGDDPDADIDGAYQAGLQPVWTTCVQDQNIPSVPGVLGRIFETPEQAVPRISTWGDLLRLLDLEDMEGREGGKE